jgi:hypothetical protein
VYSSRAGCPRANDTAETDGFWQKSLFQEKLPLLLESAGLTTTSPQAAGIFYHPACLVHATWRARLQTVPRGYLDSVEKRVLGDIARLGFGHMPHIVNALRCRGTSAKIGLRLEQAKYDVLFPHLWGRKRRTMHRFCGQAMQPVDVSTSVLVPYCVPNPTVRRSVRRPLRAVFIGSAVASRRPLIDAARRTPGVVVEELAQRALAPNQSAAWLSTMMSQAVYTICPPGDTPESQRIYQALSVGSVPLVAPGFQPPAIAEWRRFAAPLCVLPDGSLGFPDAAAQRVLQHGAWHHAQAFSCDAGNPKMVAYLVRSLRTLLGQQPPLATEAVWPLADPQPLARHAGSAVKAVLHAMWRCPSNSTGAALLSDGSDAPNATHSGTPWAGAGPRLGTRRPPTGQLPKFALDRIISTTEEWRFMGASPRKLRLGTPLQPVQAIVCLTTVPARLPHIKPTLNALSQQHPLTADAVVLTVPRDTFPALPRWLEQLQRHGAYGGGRTMLRLERPTRDIGPAEKLRGCLQWADRTNVSAAATIAVTDDDFIRPHYWLALLAATAYGPPAAATYHDASKGFASGTVHRVYGFKGYAAAKGTWGSAAAFETFAHAVAAKCRDVDDIAISAYLQGPRAAVVRTAMLTNETYQALSFGAKNSAATAAAVLMRKDPVSIRVRMFRNLWCNQLCRKLYQSPDVLRFDNAP